MALTRRPPLSRRSLNLTTFSNFVIHQHPDELVVDEHKLRLVNANFHQLDVHSHGGVDWRIDRQLKQLADGQVGALSVCDDHGDLASPVS
jgi:hypothetical protein